MRRNDLQTTRRGGLHVYSHRDSHQICSSYNCKYVFIGASSAKTLSDLKANLCPFWLTHWSFGFCCFSAQSGFWLDTASFCFHLSPFVYKSWSRQSLWRWDPEFWLWCSTLEKLWKRLCKKTQINKASIIHIKESSEMDCVPFIIPSIRYNLADISVLFPFCSVGISRK